MLKRYTHLKAQRLVRKLDSGRNKKRQVLLDIFLPYPGLVAQVGDEFSVQILDFGSTIATGKTLDDALKNASNLLMRKLLTIAMRDGVDQLPQPDQFLDVVDEKAIVMIDPMIHTDDARDTLNFQESIRLTVPG